MAIRMTGLASGMDTESIIKELMTAKSAQKTKVEAKKTKLEWTKDIWSGLNTKLNTFYSKYASKMKLQSTYLTKKATSSDETKATVTGSATSTNGTYSLEVKQLATSQYITSGKVDDSSLSSSTSLSKTTKLSDIDSSLVGKEIEISVGGNSSYFQVRSDSTINDFTSALSSAGLNASFDTTQKRFFISSANSGVENTFSITTANLSSEELSARTAVENAVSYSSLSSDSKKIVNNALKSISDAKDIMNSGIEATSDEYKAAQDKYDAAVKSINEVDYAYQKSTIETNAKQALKAQLYYENYDTVHDTTKKTYYEDNGDVKSTYQEKFQKEWDALTTEEQEKTGYSTAEEYISGSVEKLSDKATESALSSKINSLISSDSEVKARLVSLQESGVSSIDSYSAEDIEKFGLKTYAGLNDVTVDSVTQENSQVISDYANVATRTTALSGTGSLSKLGLTDVTVDTDGSVLVAGGANDSSNANIPTGMAVVEGKDSIVLLNGAELTSTTTTLNANGLSISLKGETNGSKISLTVDNDVDAVYNSIKDFLKEYNSLLTEMNTLLDADSAKGYDVLTDDEKEAMTDDEVTKWETKIKDSLLRNDSTLSGIVSSMRNSMMKGVEVDGKNYSLSSLGIMTSTDYTEGGQLHIYGDTDDSVYADKTDKLRAMISSDPQTLMNIMTKIGENLRSTMADKMKATSLSSALTFYNDKQMKTQIDDYEDDISEWEDRLTDIEDRYYTQFSQMESAMSSLNSTQNSLSSLFG